MLQKSNPLQTQYVKDADLMATKSRFGYFSILPSHTAGITDYAQKTAHKDDSGKVVIPAKGIYSGSKSTKVLSRTCFSEITSPFVGCPYVDPGKPERQKLLEEKKKWTQKEIFKPARLQKTLIASSYPYKQIKAQDKTKEHRNEDGKVITSPPNICANALSKLQYQRTKTFKYTEDSYDNKKIMRKQELDADLAKTGETFKAGNPIKDFFENNKKLFDDTSNVDKKVNTEAKQTKTDDYTASKIKHETSFRPSSGIYTRYGGLFNKITYKEEGEDKQRPKTSEKGVKHSEPFLSRNKVMNSRPCPSISSSKINLMRCIR